MFLRCLAKRKRVLHRRTDSFGQDVWHLSLACVLSSVGCQCQLGNWEGQEEEEASLQSLFSLTHSVDFPAMSAPHFFKEIFVQLFAFVPQLGDKYLISESNVNAVGHYTECHLLSWVNLCWMFSFVIFFCTCKWFVGSVLLWVDLFHNFWTNILFENQTWAPLAVIQRVFLEIKLIFVGLVHLY